MHYALCNVCTIWNVRSTSYSPLCILYVVSSCTLYIICCMLHPLVVCGIWYTVVVLCSSAGRAKVYYGTTIYTTCIPCMVYMCVVVCSMKNILYNSIPYTYRGIPLYILIYNIIPYTIYVVKNTTAGIPLNIYWTYMTVVQLILYIYYVYITAVFDLVTTYQFIH